MANDMHPAVAAFLKENAELVEAAFAGMQPLKDTVVEHLHQSFEFNDNVATVKATEADDPKHLLNEIRDQNPNNDAELAKLNKRREQLMTEYEKLTATADKIAEKYMPSKEEIEAKAKSARDEIQKNSSDLRTARKTVIEMGTLFAKANPKIAELIDKLPELSSLRGFRKSGDSQTSGNESGIKRPRFKKITINDLEEFEKNGKTSLVYNVVNGERRYTLTTLAKALNGFHRAFNLDSAQLVSRYEDALPEDGTIPEMVEIPFEYTWKNAEGNEQTIVYNVKLWPAAAK